MSTIVLTPEIEARIREIVREELGEAEIAHRPPWHFDRMDAAMRRVEENRQPTRVSPSAAESPEPEPPVEA